MDSETEMRQEIAKLSAMVYGLIRLVKDLAVSIRSTQEPMSVREFAERVGISEGMVRKQIKEGRIIKKGRKILPVELLKFGM